MSAKEKVKSNVTKATFLQAYDEYSSSIGELDRLKSKHQALCKVLKGRGIELDELKDSYKIARMDRDRRETRFGTLAKYMIWLEKPIGYQSDLINDTTLGDETQEDIEASEKHAMAEAYQAGYAAGKSGAGDAFCSFEPGSECYQQYMLGVQVGSELAKPKKEKSTKPTSSDRPRGRPRRDPGLKSETPGDPSVQSHTWAAGEAVGTA